MFALSCPRGRAVDAIVRAPHLHSAGRNVHLAMVIQPVPEPQLVRLSTPAGAAHSLAVAPHAVFNGRYERAEDKHGWVQKIFDETAGDYDRVEGWLSLGSGRWYRRQALARAGIRAGMTVADVACGTGLVSREALALVGPTGVVIGLDPSEGMLERAAAALGGFANFMARPSRAESLELDDQSVDAVTFGYALRHVDDIGLALSEFRRVLRPGGTVCMLEITQPTHRAGKFLLKAYMRILAGVVCRFSRLSARTPELWDYYWDTIEKCVPPEAVLECMRRAGFTDVRRGVQLGIFSEYVGRAP